MTLDTLQEFFQILCRLYPFATIVCVGLPGSPNTQWPKSFVLNNDLQARSMARLLSHLIATDQINSDPAIFEPTFIISFGAHSLTLSQFASAYLNELPELKWQIRAFIVVNGLLRCNKKFQSTCKEVRKVMMDGNTFEVNELLINLHFMNDYLVHEGKNSCLDKFWSTRRGLAMLPLASSSATTASIAPTTDTLKGLESDKAGLGYVGVLEQLRAFMDVNDIAKNNLLTSSDIPLLVIQSTEDIFVDPKNATVYHQDKLASPRYSISDIVNCLDTNAVHVSWLKAGHEVLQERTPFFIGLVGNLAR